MLYVDTYDANDNLVDRDIAFADLGDGLDRAEIEHAFKTRGRTGRAHQHHEAKAMNMNTPWGYADHAEAKPNGIVWYSTPSHGGFKVPSAINKLIPAAVRNATFNGAGNEGWYEEDCDWSVVARYFPDIFTEAERAAAAGAYDHWIAPKVVSL